MVNALRALSKVVGATSWGLDLAGFIHRDMDAKARADENERYWRDYYHNTGVRPKYPYRAGAVNDRTGMAIQRNQALIRLLQRM